MKKLNVTTDIIETLNEIMEQNIQREIISIKISSLMGKLNSQLDRQKIGRIMWNINKDGTINNVYDRSSIDERNKLIIEDSVKRMIISIVDRRKYDL